MANSAMTFLAGPSAAISPKAPFFETAGPSDILLYTEYLTFGRNSRACLDERFAYKEFALKTAV